MSRFQSLFGVLPHAPAAHPARAPRARAAWGSITLLTLVAAGALPADATAQDAPQDPESPAPTRQDTRGELRLGISLGGTGFLGLVTEYRRNGWSGEVTLGTVSFREISVSIAGKRYFSGGNLQPAVGLGLWSLTAWTEDGSGSILLFRAPFAVDWRATGGHYLGVEVAMNRALFVNRLDPDDDMPPSRHVVPIPGFYYRYGWEP